MSVFQKESKAARKVECREQGWFKIVREPQFPLNAIKAEASLSAKFLRFFAEDSLALEALVDSLALKMRIRIRWG